MSGIQPVDDNITVEGRTKTRSQWLDALHRAHAGLLRDPNDHDAKEAIRMAGYAISQAPLSEQMQTSTGASMLAGVKPVAKGLGEAIVDIPRGIAALRQHPIDVLGQLTGIGNWNKSFHTFNEPFSESGLAEKLDALMRATPFNMGYSAERALLDATGATSDQAASTQEQAHAAGNVASLGLLGVGAKGSTKIPGTAGMLGDAVMRPIRAAGNLAAAPIKAVGAGLQMPAAALDLLRANAEAAKARAASATETARLRGPLLEAQTELTRTRNAGATEAAAQRAARAPHLDAAAKARAQAAEAAANRQPMIDRAVEARAQAAEGLAGRQPGLGENLDLRNELLRRAVEGGGDEGSLAAPPGTLPPNPLDALRNLSTSELEAQPMGKSPPLAESAAAQPAVPATLPQDIILRELQRNDPAQQMIPTGGLDPASISELPAGAPGNSAVIQQAIQQLLSSMFKKPRKPY